MYRTRFSRPACSFLMLLIRIASGFGRSGGSARSPIAFDVTHTDILGIDRKRVAILLERKAVGEGDVLLITEGDPRGPAGGTNGEEIVRVGGAGANRSRRAPP